MRGKMKSLLNMLKMLHAEERGQGMTEYVLIVVLIAIAVIGAVIFFRSVIIGRFKESGSAVPAVNTNPSS
jgi:pilus assembly protein Flp/PilA